MQSPISDIYPNGYRCIYTFAKIAADLHQSIGVAFFRNLLLRPIEIALVAGRIFMMFCGFRTFAGICEKMENLTEKNPIKIGAFLRMLCPSYKRLVGNEVFATRLMCTIINLSAVIREKSEIEMVVDVICLLCSKLKLVKHKVELMSAARVLPKRERELMEAALDIEIESY